VNVSVRELKDRLSEFLRRVQKGERVVITDHGRTVAEIVALDPERLSPRERLELMAGAAEVTLPRGKGFADVKRSRIRGRPVSETLLEDRR
jgi:prevent-host-death family protein